MRKIILASLLVLTISQLQAQGTRLLRQPGLSARHIAFVYGGDIWVVGREGGEARRITSTAATESDPHFSPDGKWIAFTSDRSGIATVYIVPVEGGTPTRLTWFPAPSRARGWSPDGKSVVYATTRETAPSTYNRLWTVSMQGGPSSVLPAPWAFDGGYSADGKRLVVDRMSRWDVEWRSYRGGQNTPLRIMDLKSLEEKELPNADRTMDKSPVWVGDDIYFLSDRDGVMNIWAYASGSGSFHQVTKHKGNDVKWISTDGKDIAYEWNGYLHVLEPGSGKTRQLDITVRGDFPWAETRWENVTTRASNAMLSPTGKRIILESRGDIFTVPVENGDPRNLTASSGVADRRPLWSPDGRQVAWFSDEGGKGYALMLTDQEGKTKPKRISIGESKLAWEACWSPDGKYIAFDDDDVRVRVLELSTGKITTVDTGGNNLERGNMGLMWSPDSKWLAYAKAAPNNFRRITLWSLESGRARALTDPMADAMSPVWDRDGHYLYFLASTNEALGSGWANTSSMQAKPTYGAYLTVLRKDDPDPFPLKTDEEPDSTVKESKKPKDSTKAVKIDWDRIDVRTLALPVPVSAYDQMIQGPKGTVFIASGPALSKFSVEGKKLDDFVKGGNDFVVSANGEKLLFNSGGTWRVVSTAKPPSPGEGAVSMTLRMQLDRLAEWAQIFEEAWRYEKEYFYDPNMHGRDWDDVHDRYAPLVPYIRHRSDLTYVLDMVNGELSVGHSFVFGGDYPAVDTSRVGTLGADLEASQGRWRIKRIYTSESWNPGLSAPLARPDLKLSEGDLILAIDGVPLTADMDPYQLLDGKANKQVVLTINNKPVMDGSWTIRISPGENENALRQRGWVEDNRRKVDELSHGKLGYVWVPNTSQPGFISFNRYFFAQQDKQGAVIDERFNGGGLLDDYMVDLMSRRVRAALTNEVPGGASMKLPAGILGPKVLLINELSGSGGDFFPWVFRHQKVGPLVGTRTWGGLVKSSVHYSLVDGGALTAPDNAVFDPVAHKWVAENEGVPPDVEVKLDAVSHAKGRDPQLEKGVQEALKLLEQEPKVDMAHPPYSKPAKRN